MEVKIISKSTSVFYVVIFTLAYFGNKIEFEQIIEWTKVHFLFFLGPW